MKDDYFLQFGERIKKQHPYIKKVWRPYGYTEGNYECSVCMQEATIAVLFKMKHDEKEIFIKNGEWHNHCAHNIMIDVVCINKHYTKQLYDSACECGWKNAKQFSKKKTWFKFFKNFLGFK